MNDKTSNMLVNPVHPLLRPYGLYEQYNSETEKMVNKIRRTADPDISYFKMEGETRWCDGIIELKVDTRNRKFIVTPIMHGRSEGPPVDVTDMSEKFQREQNR